MYRSEGEVKWALGMRLGRGRSPRTISISHETFAYPISARFSLTDTAPVMTPLTPNTHHSAADFPTTESEKAEMATSPCRESVGALAWVALGTRHDIALATNSLTCVGHNPGHIHWGATRRVLRYLKGTKG